MVENYLDIPHREGFFELDEYDLYYRAFGKGDTVLLVLHGGPGGHGDILAPLAEHGDDEVTVYLYDQFGGGQSDRPATGDFDRYTVNHYREEVEAIRATLGAESIVLYGHSWGGMLALEYVLEYPAHVSKLILSGAIHDVEDAIEVMRSAREAELTDEELETVREHEANRTFDDSDYQKLTEKVYGERLFRTERPTWAKKSEANMDIYGLMWGPTEFALADTARLRGWSVKDQLDKIETRTLVIVGEYDEIGPEISSDIAAELPNAQFEVIDDASHYPCWETPETHYDIVETFLNE